MFKRKFKNEFEFSEDSFLLKGKNKLNDFDRSVFVVYEYSELLDFFELDQKGKNVMICIFNKHLYTSLCLIEEIKGLIVIDASKNKTEIFEDLKLYFKKSSNLIPKLPDIKFVKANMPAKQLEKLQRALFFMM